MRYFLDQDDSGHWYLIPAKKRPAWDVWTSMAQDAEGAWDVPAYAKRINGHPCWITFKKPEQK